MSIFSTILVFAVTPLAVVIVIGALAALGGSHHRPDRRYRPGRPYDFAPTWFLASPAQVSPALGKTSGAQALESGEHRQVRPGPVGGASDRW
ncbi:hypothetical protein AB0M36_16225 [Actinoplanes sp. NPDC051346]|uniref:aa3-type cytochrome oxidase subunit CtaJ n=1 Tax=Actinoplanes sp. NPDC051346 TaxID=3155048 RepID=UPI003429B430